MENSVVEEIIAKQEISTMDVLIPGPGTQADQLVELLKAHFDNRVITGIELGTLEGATLTHVIEKCPNITMIAIDVAPIASMFRIKTSKYEDRVLLMVARTDCAIDHWNKRNMGKVDFVWIDADHEYHQVKKDILNYLCLIREGGIIGGHDYACARALGVAQAVREIFPADIVHLGRDLTWWVYVNDIKLN